MINVIFSETLNTCHSFFFDWTVRGTRDQRHLDSVRVPLNLDPFFFYPEQYFFFQISPNSSRFLKPTEPWCRRCSESRKEKKAIHETTTRTYNEERVVSSSEKKRGWARCFARQRLASLSSFSPFQIIKKSYVALRPETCSDVPTLGTKLMRLLKSRLIRCGPSGPVVLMSSDISKFCRR